MYGGPKITENSWKSAHVGAGGRERKGDRSNEADSLFSVFSASGGIGRLSGRAFFSLPPRRTPRPLRCFLSRPLPPRTLARPVVLSFAFPSRGVTRPSCRELVRALYPFFSSVEPSRHRAVPRKTFLEHGGPRKAPDASLYRPPAPPDRTISAASNSIGFESSVCEPETRFR